MNVMLADLNPVGSTRIKGRRGQETKMFQPIARFAVTPMRPMDFYLHLWFESSYHLLTALQYFHFITFDIYLYHVDPVKVEFVQPYHRNECLPDLTNFLRGSYERVYSSIDRKSQSTLPMEIS